jgi:hypothetical protein
MLCKFLWSGLNAFVSLSHISTCTAKWDTLLLIYLMFPSVTEDYTALGKSDDRELWTRKNVQGSSHSLIYGNIVALASRCWGQEEDSQWWQSATCQLFQMSNSQTDVRNIITWANFLSNILLWKFSWLINVPLVWSNFLTATYKRRKVRSLVQWYYCV